MEPVPYIIHLAAQGVSLNQAREHAKLRFGLTDDAIDARIREAIEAATETLSVLGSDQ